MHFGLIGYPISHSLSPSLFKAGYPQFGLKGPFEDYTYDLIERSDFNEAYAIFRREYDSINVTAPFKELAYKAADSADTITHQIGASNLLTKTNGSILAYNTDFWAVSQLLRLYLPYGEKPEVLVIGCGGAGKAAAIAALNLHLKVTIANRDFEKGEQYSLKMGEGSSAIHLDQIAECIERFGVVIYTIPAPIPQLTYLHLNTSSKLILEANYKNPCLSGENYISGIKWLKYQALISFNIMTHVTPDEEAINRLLITISK